MALITADFISEKLMRTVTVKVILPTDKLAFPGMPVKDARPYKTLYLLHGIFGNYTDWVSGTNVQRFAEENDLAVVMPSGENMFYVDQPGANNYYGEFIGRELVEQTRKMFHLSDKREDTFIAGLSMGGYGALRNGLKYSDTFGRIAAFSSALIIEELPGRTNDAPFFMNRRDYAESVFGDLDKVLESDKNPKWLAKKLVEEGKELPEIYMACGTKDGLMGANIDFRDYLLGLGYHVDYDEEEYGHEWTFWGHEIEKIMKWLPLGDNVAGISSGNVGI